MVLNTVYPVVVYSDKSALVNRLGKDDGTGRIASWRVRMAEYNIDLRHVKLKDMSIADGLARMPYEHLDQISLPWSVLPYAELCDLKKKKKKNTWIEYGSRNGRTYVE